VAESAAEARQLVSRVLPEWGLADAEEKVLLVVTELISNGVRHANTDLTLFVGFDGERLRIEVTDFDDRLPVVAPDSRAHHGWGLRLIGTLSTDWGTRVSEGGKTVWCDLDLGESEAS
jgi:anti-sigma regulatory factor (Ser/Thr protein kinase)